jgi:hypothetical protein
METWRRGRHLPVSVFKNKYHFKKWKKVKKVINRPVDTVN